MAGFFRKINEFFHPENKDRRLNISELEDMLIEADLGGSLAVSIAKSLSQSAKDGKVSSLEDISKILCTLLDQKVSEYKISGDFNSPNVFLILGVNGSGKTTTCAKLANYYKQKQKKVLLAAADTFRAAAAEQLSQHAERVGVRIVRSDNAGNPAAVIFDALSSLLSAKDDVLIADTAGRMHTKENLVKEIQKIDKIVSGKIPQENYKKFLVLDGTTGQNALSQAENFDKALGIDALIITKLDSQSKGGALIRIADSLKIPVAFVCNGEKYQDIRPFDKGEFIKSILA